MGDEPEEYRELDAERVLSTFRGRGKLSGLQVDQKVAELFEIHAGKVTRIVVYFDRATALADVGVAE